MLGCASIPYPPNWFVYNGVINTLHGGVNHAKQIKYL